MRIPGAGAAGRKRGKHRPRHTGDHHKREPDRRWEREPDRRWKCYPHRGRKRQPDRRPHLCEATTAGSTLTLGSRDNGGTYCLRVGQEVIVYLQGSPAHMWAPIRSDSGDLRPRPNGSLMLMRGVTGAAFTAVRPGIAHITSARPVCTARPVRCDALIAFHVTVDLAGHPQ